MGFEPEDTREGLPNINGSSIGLAPRRDDGSTNREPLSDIIKLVGTAAVLFVGAFGNDVNLVLFQVAFIDENVVWVEDACSSVKLKPSSDVLEFLASLEVEEILTIEDPRSSGL